MARHTRGTDITVRWSLDLEGLSSYDLVFEYTTGAGSKTVTDYDIIDDEIVWTFPGEEQVFYGSYTLKLTVLSQGDIQAVYRKDDAFEIVHGLPEQDATIPLESSLEVESTTPEEQQTESQQEEYISTSPLHIEKIPLGSNIILYWKLIAPPDFDFNIEDCELRLSYEATGSGFERAEDYSLSTDEGYVITWNFAAEKQIRFGIYNLYLGLFLDGVKVATLVREDAFILVHRSRSEALTDRIIHFESVVTSSNGGALYSLSDVLNNGYDSVFRLDGVTPAEVGDFLVYGGSKWYATDEVNTSLAAIDGRLDSVVSIIDGQGYDLDGLRADLEAALEAIRQNTAWIRQDETSMASLVVEAGRIAAQVSNIYGDMASLEILANQIQTRVSNAEGDLSTITQRANSIDLRVSDAEGNIGDLELTATALTSRMSDAEGNVSTLQQTATTLTSQIANTQGDVSVLQQTASSLTSLISDANGNISALQQTATSLSSRISDAEGDISTIDQKADGIQAQVTNQAGDISTLQISARGITSRVEDVEGNYSLLEQDVSGIHQEVQALVGDLDDYETYVNGVIGEIQDQIDGAIDTWFYNGTPTLSNLPASQWTDNATKDMHLGDVYYDNLTGYAYRFAKSGNNYVWTEITDSAVVDALTRARNAQDTADNKRRVFIAQPYTPYDPGDLWVQGHTQDNDGTIYRCFNGKQTGSFDPDDWELASDFVSQDVVRANFDVLADAIIGTVAQYGPDGKITSNTASQFRQTVSDISFSVTKVGSALLPTGINIADQLITIRSDNFILAGNGVGSPAALTLTYRNNVPYISAANLDVTGIFTTQAWTDANSQALNTFYTDNVAPIAGDVSDLSDDVSNLSDDVSELGDTVAAIPDLSYLKAATNNGTLISGGLVLTSLIQLGGVVDGSYRVMSGINGIADNTKTGKGIAAWYGGPMVDVADHLTDNPIPDHAKTLFRMDGSGYIADRAIYWSDQGDLHIHGNVVLGTDPNDTVNSIIGFVTHLASWFVEDTTTIPGKTLLRINMGTQGATGFEGVIFDGFLITGGDQVVQSGTPGGGGSGGGATSLTDLVDVYPSTKPSAQKILVFDPQQLDKNGHQGAWVYADMPTGSVTSISVNGNSYSPSNGVVTLPNYPTTLPASDVSAWAKASTKPSYSLSEISGTSDLQLIEALTGGGLLKRNSNNTWELDSNTYLTGNQTITLGGDVSGSGTTSITVSIGAGKVTNTMLANSSITIGATTVSLGGTSTTLTMGNNQAIQVTNNPSSGNATVYNALYMSTSNNLVLGNAGYNVYLSGAELRFRYGSSSTLAMRIGTNGNISMGTATSNASYKLDVTGDIRASQKIYIGTSGAYFEYHPETQDSAAYVSLNVAFLTEGDQIVQSGTPGGGGGGGGAGFLYELGDVLTDTNHTKVKESDGSTNADTGDIFAFNGSKWYALKLGTGLSIDTSGSQNVLNGTTYSAGAGTTAVTNTTNRVWSAANLNSFISTQGYTKTAPYSLPLAENGTRGGIQIGYSSSGKNYAVQLSSEKAYVNVPWTDTTYKLTLNNTTNGASGGTSLGSFYAPTAGGASNKVLIGNGTTSAPTWSGFTLTGTASTAYDLATISSNASNGNTAYTNLSNYLPLAGGEITGTIRFSGYTNTTPFIRNFTYTGSSGWARGLASFQVDGVGKFTIGVNGSYTAGATDNGINYAYIGVNAYNGINLRFYSNSTLTFGDNAILHEGNYTSYTPILNSASTHTTSSTVIYAPTTSGTTGQILKATTSGAPVWTSSALGASNKPIYLNSSGVLTEGESCLPSAGGTLSGALYYPLTLNNSTSGATYTGIRFRVNSTEVGTLYVNTSNALTFYDETGYRTVYHSGNTSIASSAVTIGSSTVGSSDAPIGYATQTSRLKRYVGTNASGGYDLNTLLSGGGITSQYSSSTYWANRPSGMYYGGAVQLNTQSTDTLAMQLAWDVIHADAETGRLWWRDKTSVDGGTWGSWHRIFDSHDSLIPSASATYSLGNTTYRWSGVYTGAVNASGNASIGGTLSVTGAATFSSTGAFSSNVTVGGYVAVGTGASNGSYLGSDSTTNIWLHNSAGYALVCDGLVVRRGSSASTATLGNSTYRWGGVYSTTGSFNGVVTVLQSSNSNGFRIDGTTYNISFMIGSANVNRGIYSHDAGKWLLYFDATDTIANNGAFRPGTTNAHDLGTSDYRWKGVYSATLNTSGNASIGGTLGVTGATTISSTLSVASHIYITTNNRSIYMKDTAGTNRVAFTYSNNDYLQIGAGTYNKPSATIIYGTPITFHVYDTTNSADKVPFRMELNETNGGVLKVNNNADNTGAGEIIFQARNSTGRNGIKIASEYAASASRQNLVIYTSNNSTSPYAPVWTDSFRIRYDGLVSMGGAVEAGVKLKVYGAIVSTGDQSIASDATLKKNIKDLDLTVEQIAKLPAVTFDWKDGRGSSFGTVAQSVLPVFPQAVHGEEGSFTVAYGQGGWVFGVKNAMAIVDLQNHETEQDKEINRLKARVKELEQRLNIC